jgi:diguanylate cyclase (GGDEF)-like protein
MLDNELWFRITLPVDKNFDYLEVDNPYLDRVQLYSRRLDGSFQMQEAGDSIPFDRRTINYRTFVFELDNEELHNNVYYLKISSRGAVHFLINLWTEKEFLQYASTSQGLIGLYYGLLIVMAIYNLLIFLCIRERTHLYYVVYTLMFGLFIASVSGVAFQYLWPNNQQWAQLSTCFFTGLVIFTAFQFAREFLQTRVHAPRLDKVILGLMLLSLLQMLMIFVGDILLATRMAIGIGICLPPVILLTAVLCWSRGYRPARFMILGWSFLLLTIFTSALMYADLLPANFFTVYGMQIGSGLEIILLSLALADKMALLKQERTELQMAYSRQLEGYSQILEKKVSERTSELQTAMCIARRKNRELERANKHLTDLATHDGLTGLLNHHTFIEQFKHVIEDARRYKYPLVVMMIDLDYFKHINDTFGHLSGNEVLRKIAQIFSREVRESDLAARYGGEEFTLILTRTSLAEAMTKAEVIRQQAKTLQLENAPGMKLTISVGLAAFDPLSQSADYNLLLSQADQALYKAKQQGRDRVCSASRKLTMVASRNISQIED